MRFKRLRLSVLGLNLMLLIPCVSFAQRERGELRVEARDSQGSAVAGSGELVSELNQVHRAFKVGPDGRSVVQGLPFGQYHLRFEAQGFADWSGMVEIRSVLPQTVAITLGVAPVSTQIQVSDSATLLDPSRTGVTYAIGRSAIERLRLRSTRTKWNRCACLRRASPPNTDANLAALSR